MHTHTVFAVCCPIGGFDAKIIGIHKTQKEEHVGISLTNCNGDTFKIEKFVETNNTESRELIDELKGYGGIHIISECEALLIKEEDMKLFQQI